MKAKKGRPSSLLKVNSILLISIYMKSKSSLSAFSKVERSLEESLHKIFITNFCLIVDIADLTADGFNKPAPCQSSIKNSPIPIWLLV